MSARSEIGAIDNRSVGRGIINNLIKNTYYIIQKAKLLTIIQFVVNHTNSG